jgi:hypothetical protein
MNDSTDLLDRFTQILAYIGDDGAKDGYFLRENNAGNPVYSINIRPEPMPEESVARLVKKIKILLKTNIPVTGFPADVVAKTNELKDLYDSSSTAAKKELLEYISEFGTAGMRGGRNTKRRSKRKSTRSKRTRARMSKRTRARR